MTNLSSSITLISKLENRPEYQQSLTINGRSVKRVIIDQHYKTKHAELNDELILEMVAQLDGRNFPIDERRGNFEYFRVEPVTLQEKRFRLVLVLCVGEDYLGVVNAFRVRRK